MSLRRASLGSLALAALAGAFVGVGIGVMVAQARIEARVPDSARPLPGVRFETEIIVVANAEDVEVPEAPDVTTAHVGFAPTST